MSSRIVVKVTESRRPAISGSARIVVPFKRRHFDCDLVALCMRWYLGPRSGPGGGEPVAFRRGMPGSQARRPARPSLREAAGMMAERGTARCRTPRRCAGPGVAPPLPGRGPRRLGRSPERPWRDEAGLRRRAAAPGATFTVPSTPPTRHWTSGSATGTTPLRPKRSSAGLWAQARRRAPLPPGVAGRASRPQRQGVGPPSRTGLCGRVGGAGCPAHESWRSRLAGARRGQSPSGQYRRIGLSTSSFRCSSAVGAMRGM